MYMSIFYSMLLVVCITAIVPSGLGSLKKILSSAALQQDAFHKKPESGSYIQEIGSIQDASSRERSAAERQKIWWSRKVHNNTGTL